MVDQQERLINWYNEYRWKDRRGNLTGDVVSALGGFMLTTLCSVIRIVATYSVVPESVCDSK